MAAVLYIFLAIIITMLCYVIFSIGRVYELSIIIREYEDAIELLQMEIDNMDKLIAELEGGDE